MKTSPDAILAAAYVCFARYGFKRVALEQIAQEAGISRAALYLHFRNKGAILRALSHQHHEQMQSEAARAARLPGPLDKRLEAILCAKLGQLVDRIYASSHAAEILDENSRLCGDDSGVYHKKFPRVLRVPPAEAAELLLDSAKGLDRSGLAGNPARHRLRSSN